MGLMSPGKPTRRSGQSYCLRAASGLHKPTMRCGVLTCCHSNSRATNIHMRYKERNFSDVNKSKQQPKLFLPSGLPMLVEPTSCPGLLKPAGTSNWGLGPLLSGPRLEGALGPEGSSSAEDPT
ncbi:hypothetical protein Pyn_36248 [Prunus yedoensis var. nudiflora]|uniref:Uncharacterized protein n=1 Tax=Prunus yedoensis var. nudiflora TaxID=2094558 RepID=A0A314U6G2_PRUYE|nr:hypothetical protein Pyn_36248 [Prunus yedoensis var. nudiflora]